MKQKSTIIINHIGVIYLLCLNTLMHSSWAEHTVATMSLEEKIGQLCIVAAVSNTDELNNAFLHDPINLYRADPAYISSLITQYHVGGVIFLGLGRVQQQIELTRQWQALSHIPLLVALDCEWGLSMRLVDGMRFARAMTLGAMDDETVIYQVGYTLAQQARSAGIHLILGPVVDVKSNPNNPILTARSFGDDPVTVARKGALFIHGVQDGGLLACAKHFPGRGDTITDPHQALTIIRHDRERIDTIDLPPFVHALNNNVDAIMTGHFITPGLSNNHQEPVTTSRTAVHDFLRQQLHFKGLIVTDGLGMLGITKLYEPGELEVAAVRAGHDILLCPVNVPRTVAAIKNAVHNGIIDEQELNEHVMRILTVKEQLMTKMPESFSPTYQPDLLYSPAAYAVKKAAYQHAITCIHDEIDWLSNSIPPSTAQVIVAGTQVPTRFEQQLTTKIQAIDTSDIVIVGLFNIHQHKQRMYGLDRTVLETLRTHKQSGKMVIVCVFGAPYCTPLLKECAHAILVAYEDDPDAQEAAVNVLLKQHHACGKLPITL